MNWTIIDLKNLIETQAKESLNLEFKASDALSNTDKNKNELSKDISAFANSAGGTIIYGMVEQSNVASRLDNGLDPTITTKEWIEQIINSTIMQKIDGIVIHQVALNSLDGNVIYVIEIPQSYRAPHQAFDKKFYKRYNFQSIPMEEYEVRDIFRRSESPDLRLSFEILENEVVFHSSSEESLPSNSIGLKIRIHNEGESPAEYAFLRIKVDNRLILKTSSEIQSVGIEKIQVANTVVKLNVLIMKWAIPYQMPIFKGLPYLICDKFSFQIPRYLDYAEDSFIIMYELHSPRMSSKGGVQLISISKNNIRLSDWR